MRQNDIHGAEAGKAFSNMLAQNTVLIELDLSSQNVYGHTLDAAFAKELAVGIIDNGALMSLDISKNNVHTEGTKLLAETLKSNQIMTALNISSNNMTYNGNNKDYGDMSGIAALADAMPGMRAMTSLNLSSNAIELLVLPAGWTTEGTHWDPIYKHSDGREQEDHPGEPEGIIAVANAIKDMGALTCADGKYYHEWRLNLRYKSAEDVINENKEQMLARLKAVDDMDNGEQKQKLLQELGVSSVPTKKRGLLP
jgi:hypothetical protein